MVIRALLSVALGASACASQPPQALSVSPGPTEHAPAPVSSTGPSAAVPADRANNRGAEPTTPAPEAVAATPDASIGIRAETPATAAESPALSTLKRYYADLNGRKFEAARYFAPSVKQYITMQRPSNSALNHYVREVFPKQFESYEFLFDEQSLREEGPNVYTYLERCRYYVVKVHEFRTILAQVRIELDADGKIMDLRHARVLAREVTPEQR